MRITKDDFATVKEALQVHLVSEVWKQDKMQLLASATEKAKTLKTEEEKTAFVLNYLLPVGYLLCQKENKQQSRFFMNSLGETLGYDITNKMFDELELLFELHLGAKIPHMNENRQIIEPESRCPNFTFTEEKLSLDERDGNNIYYHGEGTLRNVLMVRQADVQSNRSYTEEYIQFSKTKQEIAGKDADDLISDFEEKPFMEQQDDKWPEYLAKYAALREKHMQRNGFIRFFGFLFKDVSREQNILKEMETTLSSMGIDAKAAAARRFDRNSLETAASQYKTESARLSEYDVLEGNDKDGYQINGKEIMIPKKDPNLGFTVVEGNQRDGFTIDKEPVIPPERQDAMMPGDVITVLNEEGVEEKQIVGDDNTELANKLKEEQTNDSFYADDDIDLYTITAIDDPNKDEIAK